MSRGNHREDIFLDDQDWRTFLQPLGEACAKTGWQVHAYCPMGNHFHLVAETPQAVRGIENLLVEGNVFELALPTGADPVPIAVHVDKAGATFQPHEQVIVRNNRFRYFGGLMGAYEGLAVQVTGARNVLVRDNVIETMPSNDTPVITESPSAVTFLNTGVGYLDNRTMATGLVPRMDLTTGKPVEEYDMPTEDTLATACFER